MDAITKRWIRDKSDELAVANGCVFDPARGEYVVDWIEANCYLHEGVPPGTKMKLLPWAKDAVMRLFGWIRPAKGTIWENRKIEGINTKYKRGWLRRFREASIWVPKKNGKSPLLAALGCYLLFGDGEHGQKVFTCARDGQQAMIAHRHGMGMVRASPHFNCRPAANTGRMWDEETQSTWSVVAGDNINSQEGLNGSALIDECFVSGTKISTPNGFIDINEVKPGHGVYNALGIGHVLAISDRQSDDLYRLEFDDGTAFECTGNHPIFSARGWTPARALVEGEITYSREALRDLQERVSALAVCGKNGMQGRNGSSNDGAELFSAEMLFNILLQEAEESDAQRRYNCESAGYFKGHEALPANSRRKRKTIAASSTRHSICARSGLGSGALRLYGYGSAFGLPIGLQDRYCQSYNESRIRDRRRIAQQLREAKSRSKEAGFSRGVRVVSVQRVECARPRTVYNLQVSGHPSYFAEGKLVHNCHVVDRRLMDVMKYMGRSRAEPLRIEVSTAGSNSDGYGKSRFDLGTDIAEGKVKRDDLLFVSHAVPQDTTDDQIAADPLKYIRMANPAIGYILDENILLKEYEDAKKSISDMLTWKMYTLNIWQRSSNPWLKMGDWSKCFEDFTDDDLKQCECRGAALDMSRVADMAALALIFRHPTIEGAVRAKVYLFWPEEVAREHRHEAPFLEWARDGHLILTPGNTMDVSFVRSFIIERHRETPFPKLAYDEWNADGLTQELAEGAKDHHGHAITEGLGIERVPFPQSIKNFSQPTDLFESMVIEGKFRHNGNPCLTWQAGHVQVARDTNGNKRPIKPDGKKESIKKIDGIIAAVMALAIYQVPAPSEPSIFVM